MSTPGGYDGYGQNPQQYDPLTGQPIAPQGQPGPSTGGYQGLGAFPSSEPVPAQSGQFPAQSGQFPAQSGQFPAQSGQFPQQQYPGQPQYQGGRPPRRNGPIIAAAAATVVVIVAVAVTIILINKNDDEAAAPGPTTTSQSTTSRSSSTRPTTTRPTASSNSVTPSVPPVSQWQTVTDPTAHASYQVPPDWKVEAPGSIVTYNQADGSPIRIATVSTYKPGACSSPSSFRAQVGFTAPTTGDPVATATNAAKTWADTLAVNYTGKVLAAPQTTSIPLSGGVTGTLAISTLTTTPTDCNPPAMLVAAMSYAQGGAVTTFILFADQGVADALPADLAGRLTATVHPA